MKRAWRRGLVLAALVASVDAGPLVAQTLTNRGFADAAVTFYPEDAPNDPVNVVGDVLVRDELFVKPLAWLQFGAGIDLRANSHDQVEREWRVDFADRTILRPAISVRRLSATIARGPLTIDVGRQFIRWGKTDIVTPTDRFAPRDFVNVISNEFLGVWGARGVAQSGAHTIELVWVPAFTPSRTPLLNQRWAPTDPGTATLVDFGADIPGGSQAGVRYSHVGDLIEYSLSAFNGFNHLPNIEVVPLSGGAAPSPISPAPVGPFVVGVRRLYPTMKSVGADVAVPTRWFAIKAEAAYSTSDTPGTDDYVLYVIQLERQSGEWQFVGGYAGEVVTEQRAALTFAPDRGLTRAIVARAAYTIGPTRSVGIEGAVRQNGRGVYSKVEYSQAYGQHWRGTVSGILIGGHSDDFLGQYHDNSNIVATLRYSF